MNNSHWQPLTSYYYANCMLLRLDCECMHIYVVLYLFNTYLFNTYSLTYLLTHLLTYLLTYLLTSTTSHIYEQQQYLYLCTNNIQLQNDPINHYQTHQLHPAAAAWRRHPQKMPVSSRRSTLAVWVCNAATHRDDGVAVPRQDGPQVYQLFECATPRLTEMMVSLSHGRMVSGLSAVWVCNAATHRDDGVAVPRQDGPQVY